MGLKLQNELSFEPLCPCFKSTQVQEQGQFAHDRAQGSPGVSELRLTGWPVFYWQEPAEVRFMDAMSSALLSDSRGGGVLCITGTC